MQTNNTLYWRYILKRLLFIAAVYYLFMAHKDFKKGLSDGYSGAVKVNAFLKGGSGKGSAETWISNLPFFSQKSF